MEIKNRTRSNLSTALCYGLAMLAFSVASTAHADAYLDALESEAGSSSVDKATVEKKTTSGEPNSPNPTTTSTVETTGDPSKLSQSEFEATLKVKKRGSFLWYSRLKQEQKELVYQDFLAGTDMEALGKKILKLFTQRQ